MNLKRLGSSLNEGEISKYRIYKMPNYEIEEISNIKLN